MDWSQVKKLRELVYKITAYSLTIRVGENYDVSNKCGELKEVSTFYRLQ